MAQRDTAPQDGEVRTASSPLERCSEIREVQLAGNLNIISAKFSA